MDRVPRPAAGAARGSGLTESISVSLARIMTVAGGFNLLKRGGFQLNLKSREGGSLIAKSPAYILGTRSSPAVSWGNEVL